MKVRLWAVIVAVATAAFFVFAFGASANLSPSTFEGNDGNLVSNGGKDWAGTGANAAPNLSVGVDLPSGTSDNSFGQGAKEDDVNTTVVAGSIPNSKADLARFAVAGETIGTDSFLYLAWSRENQSGTVNFDFEINAVAQPDLTTPGPKTLNRTVNDLLINYAFAGGSNTPTLTLRKWTGSAWGAGSTISSTCSEGATNAATVADTLGGNTSVDRPAQQFGEAAINLTCAGVIASGSCTTFADAYVKSRSSTSFTSEIKDFIAPVSLNLSNCGSLTIIKHTSPADLDQVFNYTTTGAGLSAFSLNDKGAGDTADNTKTFSNLAAGQRTVTEGADPTGFTFTSVTCTNSGGNTSSTSGRVATVSVVGGGSTTCTYLNTQQLGALKVTKASIKGNTALAGAVFTIGGGVGDKTTGSDGSVCVDHLTFGTYSVVEKSAPAGYAIDDTTSHNIVVDSNSDCSTVTAADTLNFSDTPLTDIAASANSQDDGAGGTLSTVTCKDSLNANVGNSPQGSSHDPAVSATGLKPGTYTCVIVIDP